METLLIIFSGLPGTGKTTLAQKLSREFRFPLFRIDDFVEFLPEEMLKQADPFWEDLIEIMLRFVEAQLQLGVSAIIDSVFMGEDREIAKQLAISNEVHYRPIHTYMSDEVMWRKRIDDRLKLAPSESGVATWDRIHEQRKSFIPWEKDQAIFIDGCDSVEINYSKILQYIGHDKGIDS